jgi:hypothetical protein
MNKENAEAVAKMNEDLLDENPEDFERRRHQEEVLHFAPKLIPSTQSSVRSSFGRQSMAWSQRILFDETKTRNPLPFSRIDGIKYASGTQRGHDVTVKRKTNQDAALCLPDAFSTGDIFFAVFDGHGAAGHQCSDFAKTHLPEFMRGSISAGVSLSDAIVEAHEKTNRKMNESNTFDFPGRLR